MNDRERLIETLNFGNPDRNPISECAFWYETFERWLAEGMPDSVMHPNGPRQLPSEESLSEFFGFDRNFGVNLRGTVNVNVDLDPCFEHKVLSEENGIITETGADGVTSRWSKEGHSTRQFIRFPVENREDFNNIKKHFNPDSPGRLRDGWKERALAFQDQGSPICLNAGGYYGFARSLMGLENLSYALCDEPELVEDIFEMRTECMVGIIEKVLAEVKPDIAEFWEDMAYKTASLVSPDLYRKLALKHYRTITDLLKKHGVKTILLDSDGNVDDLLPIWIDGGITCVWPFEIAAGMDPVAIRKKYGKNIGIIGGIDKRILATTKTAIKEEVMSKVPYLIESGGYIPTCDHAVPPDVSFENYMYYLDLVKDISGF